MIGVMAIIVYIIVAVLFQPGELDLTGPVHTDFYDYFNISHSIWSPDSWLAPRPLMRVYLKLVGIFNQPDVLFILLAVPALCFITAIPYSVFEMKLAKPAFLPLIAFFLVTFGCPFFPIHYQWDFGGMLSGFFATLAISQGFKALNDKENSSYFWWFWTLFLALISIECKPTYSFALLAIAIISAVFIKGRKSKILLLGIIGLLIWVYIKDKFLGPSTFLASADSNSPYAVVISPLKNFEIILYYLKNTFTLPLFIVTLFSGGVLVFYGRWRILIILFILTIAATSPLALLINRFQDTYAVFSTIVVGIIIMIAVGEIAGSLNTYIASQKSNKYIAIGALIVIFASLFFHLTSTNPTTEWMLSQRQYNHNVISSLKLITEFGRKKILFVGLKGPFYAFRNTAFVKYAYPMTGSYDVLLDKSESSLNETFTEQKNAIYLDKINWSDYSVVYVFGESGKIVAKFNTEDILSMPATSRLLLLYCGDFEDHIMQDNHSLLRAVECLYDNKEYDATLELGISALNVNKNNPWVYFILAKAYQAKDDKIKASEFINKALELEPSNSKFLSELEEIKAENQSTINN